MFVTTSSTAWTRSDTASLPRPFDEERSRMNARTSASRRTSASMARASLVIGGRRRLPMPPAAARPAKRPPSSTNRCAGLDLPQAGGEGPSDEVPAGHDDERDHRLGERRLAATAPCHVDGAAGPTRCDHRFDEVAGGGEAAVLDRPADAAGRRPVVTLACPDG